MGRPVAPWPLPAPCPPLPGGSPSPLTGEVLCFRQDRHFKGGSTDAWFLVRKWLFSLVFVNVTRLFSCDFLSGRQDLSAGVQCGFPRGGPGARRLPPPGRLFPPLPLSPRDVGTGVLPQFRAFGSPCFCLVSVDCPRGHCSPFHCPGCCVARAHVLWLIHGVPPCSPFRAETPHGPPPLYTL